MVDRGHIIFSAMCQECAVFQEAPIKMFYTVERTGTTWGKVPGLAPRTATTDMGPMCPQRGRTVVGSLVRLSNTEP